MLAATTSSFFSNFCWIHSSVGCVGRVYIQRDETEREEVLRPFGVAWLHAEFDARLLGDRRHRHLEHPVAGDRAVVERVRGVLGLLEVALVERVLVDDQRAADLEAVQVGLECGRVHRDEHVRLVAGGGDVVVGDLHLEGGHPVDGALWRADLGREVGEGGQVVAERGAHRGEAVAGQLHAVTGVAGESDHESVEDFGLRRTRSIDGVGHVNPPWRRHPCRLVVLPDGHHTHVPAGFHGLVDVVHSFASDHRVITLDLGEEPDAPMGDHRNAASSKASWRTWTAAGACCFRDMDEELVVEAQDHSCARDHDSES